MLVSKNKLHKEESPWIYWLRIDISSNDKTKETFIFAGISAEKLKEYCKLQHGEDLTDKQKNDWVKSIEKKWLDFGPKIFEKKVHYDSYGNNKILDFLKSLTKE